MSSKTEAAAKPLALKRALNLPLLVLYGLGTTVGAGIYALIGEIAAVAGYGAPFSFLIASGIAAFTACSFAELSGRYPRAAGAALYVKQGFNANKLSVLVGLMVVASGLISSAALINAFHGYLLEFVSLNRITTVLVASCLICGLAAWGIVESVAVAAIITVVEIGGLVLVIVTGSDSLITLPDRWAEFLPGADPAGIAGILVGVTLGFYAFIGFEDMVDVAEETSNVKRNLPRAILLTLGISTALYITLMTTALLSLTPSQLGSTAAPMASLFEAHTGSTSGLISLIALFAIINGALIQVVMVSRVFYGLSSRSQLPRWLSRVNPATQTPLRATLFASGLLIMLALSGNLAGLAKTTSLIMLTIFTIVNLSLVRIKLRESEAPSNQLIFPFWIPAVGACLCAGFVIYEGFSLLAAA